MVKHNFMVRGLLTVRWKAVRTKKSIKTSSLCPLKQTSDSSVSISSIQLKVDSTHLTFGNDKNGITYVKRPNNNAISFVKDRTPYSFEILGNNV